MYGLVASVWHSLSPVPCHFGVWNRGSVCCCQWIDIKMEFSAVFDVTQRFSQRNGCSQSNSFAIVSQSLKTTNHLNLVSNKLIIMVKFPLWRDNEDDVLSAGRSLERPEGLWIVCQGVYSSFQVTGMVEGTSWVLNFQFRDFFGYENLATIFLVAWFE